MLVIGMEQILVSKRMGGPRGEFNLCTEWVSYRQEAVQ